MRTKVTKWMAGISSAAMLASFSALSVPAFAAEYEAMQAEAYAASLTNEKAQTVARYFLDNGFSLEETEEMMGWYMDGLAIIESEQNANSGVATASVNTGKAYYNGTGMASTQHYGVILINNPNTSVMSMLDVKYFPHEGSSTYLVNYDLANLPFRTLNGYNTVVSEPTVTDEEGETVPAGHPRFTTITSARSEATPLAMVEFPFTVLSNSTEADIFNAFDFITTSSIPLTGANTTYTFHTYALGDFNHDGVVNNADYDYIVDFSILNFDGVFKYTSVNDDIAYEVNMLAADINKDGIVGMTDAIDLGKMING